MMRSLDEISEIAARLSEITRELAEVQQVMDGVTDDLLVEMERIGQSREGYEKWEAHDNAHRCALAAYFSVSRAISEVDRTVENIHLYTEEIRQYEN